MIRNASRKILTCFLLLAICLASFNRGLIVSGYYLKAYVQNCENKAKPAMKCGGRCQMMKKLKSEDKREQQSPASRADQVLSSKSFFATVSPPGMFLLEHYSNYTLPCISGMARSCFHPPGLG